MPRPLWALLLALPEPIFDLGAESTIDEHGIVLDAQDGSHQVAPDRQDRLAAPFKHRKRVAHCSHSPTKSAVGHRDRNLGIE